MGPQTNEIGGGAGACVDVELEGRSFTVRRSLRPDGHIDGRPAYGEAIEDEMGAHLKESGVQNHQELEGNRVPTPSRSGPNCAPRDSK